MHVAQVRHDCSPLELRRALLSLHRRVAENAADIKVTGLTFGSDEVEEEAQAAEHVAIMDARKRQPAEQAAAAASAAHAAKRAAAIGKKVRRMVWCDGAHAHADAKTFRNSCLMITVST